MTKGTKERTPCQSEINQTHVYVNVSRSEKVKPQVTLPKSRGLLQMTSNIYILIHWST